MPLDSKTRKAAIMRSAVRTITKAREHWLRQLLDWKLTGDERSADRLTKAEIRKLVEAAKAGKLFFGTG